MKKVNIAVLGATGAVGREMLKVLQERNFPINQIKALASARSAGLELPFGDGTLRAGSSQRGPGTPVSSGHHGGWRSICGQFQRIPHDRGGTVGRSGNQS